MPDELLILYNLYTIVKTIQNVTSQNIKNPIMI